MDGNYPRAVGISVADPGFVVLCFGVEVMLGICSSGYFPELFSSSVSRRTWKMLI